MEENVFLLKETTVAFDWFRTRERPRLHHLRAVAVLVPLLVLLWPTRVISTITIYLCNSRPFIIVHYFPHLLSHTLNLRDVALYHRPVTVWLRRFTEEPSSCYLIIYKREVPEKENILVAIKKSYTPIYSLQWNLYILIQTMYIYINRTIIKLT